MNKLTPVIVLSAVFATVVQSSVIRRSTIENPCATSSNTENGTFRPLETQINLTIIAARTVIEMCDNVTRTLVQDNYLVDQEIAALDNNRNNITGLSGEYTNTNMNQANPESLTPSDSVSHYWDANSGTNPRDSQKAQLQEDYKIIAKHIQYIEYAKPPVNLFQEKLVTAYENASRSLYCLLCKVDTVLRSLGSSTDRKIPPLGKKALSPNSKGYSTYIYALSKTTKQIITSFLTKYEHFLENRKG